ncbi:MAG: LytTR family transcriptional regulator [Raineya sp.]|jgi:hypothetical protein|nr:LytTR family transcriptional regulator [Raineya sp.]
MFVLSSDRKFLNIKFITIFVILIVCLHILQDFIHAHHYQYRFYFSESLLFKASWFLFIPFILLFLKVLQVLENRIFYIILSIFLISVTHIFSFAFSVFAGSWLFFDHTYGLAVIFKDTFTEHFYLYLIIYTSITIIYKYLEQKNSKENRVQDFNTLPNLPTYLDTLSVSLGRKNVVIKTQDILCICASSPYVSIQTSDNQYLYNSSLKDIHSKLNPDAFLRIHKSTILNVEKVLSYQSRLNGDYDITLQNHEVLRMSRNYAEPFKKHFSKSSS